MVRRIGRKNPCGGWGDSPRRDGGLHVTTESATGFFYVDKADVTPEMTERFEFEVDTTKANEFWRAEVAENLAKKAAEEAHA